MLYCGRVRIPPIETQRLLIRELTAADSAAVADLAGLRDRWLRWTELAYEQLAELRQPPYGERAVALRSSGELVGLVGLVPSLGPFGLLPSWPGHSARFTPEVGLFYLVDDAHRRQGIAAEAAGALVRYAFDVLHLQRVVATTERTNEASIGVMRRLGMRIECNPEPEPPWFQVVGLLEAE
jgi:RimJ/RimL family protein N-acetyltransferase